MLLIATGVFLSINVSDIFLSLWSGLKGTCADYVILWGGWFLFDLYDLVKDLGWTLNLVVTHITLIIHREGDSVFVNVWMCYCWEIRAWQILDHLKNEQHSGTLHVDHGVTLICDIVHHDVLVFHCITHESAWIRLIIYNIHTHLNAFIGSYNHIKHCPF